MRDAIEKRLHELRELATAYAKHEADRVYLEKYEKSELAILCKHYQLEGHTTVAAQEREARADERYLKVLNGLREATELALKTFWMLKVSEMGSRLWQTDQAMKRAAMNLR